MSVRSLRTMLLGAASAAALLAAPSWAEAQYATYHPYPPPPAFFPPPPPPAMLSPHHAAAIVRSLGLTPLSHARLRGPMFVIDARGQEGTPVQVTVDRRSGRVVQILRLGPGAPRIAAVPPLPPLYGPDDDEEDGEDYGSFHEDDDFPPRPQARGFPGPRSGPSVITREGVESRDLPPPGAAPGPTERDPAVTGSMPPYTSESMPRGSTSGPRGVDPLLGVPREFRGERARSAPPQPQPRTAARPGASAAPRAAPLPQPRPVDAPTLAQQETAPPPAAAPEPGAKDTQGDFPVQPLE